MQSALSIIQLICEQTFIFWDESAVIETTQPQKNHQLTHPKYRADIDGLRAIAVLSVVGFHAFPAYIKGGFIGVDIFFIISGFLISSIIFENLHRNSFSFTEFYIRRINRIFPALLIVLLASFIFGWVILLADEYTQLGKHIASGAGFISNFMLWSESGYFDNAAITKPLLHLWSLGIEEQFYIFWPLVLWVAWRSRINLLAITVIIAIISFILNVSTIHDNAVATFYSPQTRFWELLIGSCLAYLTLFKQSLLQKLTIGHGNLQSFCGSMLLVIGVLSITKERAFPGWWALLPTIGAALIISAGPQAWLNRTIFANRLLVWFGLISFPLYLWHWPLLSFANIWVGTVPSALIRLAAIGISIAFAWITYRLIERPIRMHDNKRRNVYALVPLMVLIAFVGQITYTIGGFEGLGPRSEEKSRFVKNFENSFPTLKYIVKNDIPNKYRTDCDFYDIASYRAGKATKIPREAIDATCFMKNPNKKHTLFIWGDSHAQQLYSGLKNNLPIDWNVLIVASSGCYAALERVDSTSDYCQKSNWLALKKIEENKPDVVIIAQSQGHQFQNLKKIGTQLKNLGIQKVIFTGPVPHWTSDLPKIIVRSLWNHTPERVLNKVDRNMEAVNNKLKAQFTGEKDFIFVDLMRFFCNKEGCLTRIGDDRMAGITTWDYGHLTPIASDYLAKNLLSPVVVADVS